MSIYLKVFLVVLVGTVGGWFAINHAIHSTDQLADTFTTSTTSHLSGREDNGAATMVIFNGEDPKAATQSYSATDAIDASLVVLNGNNARSGNSSGATVIIPKINSKLIARDNPPELDLANIESEDEESEVANILEQDEEDELALNEETETERADSDSDLLKRGGDGKSNKTNDSNKNKNKEKNRPKKTTITEVRKVAVQALDMAYALPAETTCDLPDDGFVRIGINYREGSYAIKGQSLSGIDQLIKIHRKCGGGKLLILQNEEGLSNTDDRLIQLRQDEIKYYLLQRNIPKNDMIFPESS